MKPIALIIFIFALSLSAIGCSSSRRAEVEITLGVPSGADSAEWRSTLGVLKKRIEKIAEGGFDFTPAGNGKYTLCLHTALTDRELEYVLTSPGRLEFWEACYWSRDLADILPWCRKLHEEEETESNRDFKMLASYILHKEAGSDPCALEGILVEAYPAVAMVLDSLKAAGIIPGGIRFGRQTWNDDFGNDLYTVYLLKCDPALNVPVIDNSFIEKIAYAAPSRKRYFPELNIVFNEKGAKLWQKITFENIGKHIAISFDGEILMVPQVFSAIEDGKVTVSTGTELGGERGALLKCIPAIVGSGMLTVPVGCKRL